MLFPETYEKSIRLEKRSPLRKECTGLINGRHGLEYSQDHGPARKSATVEQENLSLAEGQDDAERLFRKTYMHDTVLDVEGVTRSRDTLFSYPYIKHLYVL
ncbi:MAG: hypothetical protein M1834_003177 [Cirrosporium novae-zelandiae]|nr:MAG: hypothetical protein M1834_003177 [Cirrosporium novae-zelandiae]